MKTKSIACILGLMLAGATLAQQATEQYIPIGESPGLSDGTVTGTISTVYDDDHRMTIRSDSGSVTVRITGKTRFYLDSSHRKRRNYAGTFEDCEVGRRVEIDVGDDGIAAWVKIVAN